MQGQSLYVGINGSHAGHQGLSASKILHAVVCYHEATMGSGMWQWQNSSMMNAGMNNTVDHSVMSIAPLNPMGGMFTAQESTELD